MQAMLAKAMSSLATDIIIKAIYLKKAWKIKQILLYLLSEFETITPSFKNFVEVVVPYISTVHSHFYQISIARCKTPFE